MNTNLLLEANIEITKLLYKQLLEDVTPMLLREDENKSGSFKNTINRIIDKIKEFLVKIKIFMKEKFLMFKNRMSNFILRLKNSFKVDTTKKIQMPCLFDNDGGYDAEVTLTNMLNGINDATHDDMDEVREKLNNTIEDNFTKYVEVNFVKAASFIRSKYRNIVSDIERVLKESTKKLNEYTSELKRLKEDKSEDLSLIRFKISSTEKLISVAFRLIGACNSMILSVTPKAERNDEKKKIKDDKKRYKDITKGN